MYEVNGVTANQACCVCGGGKDTSNPSPVSTPTSSPVAIPLTSSPTSTPVFCTNFPSGWSDITGPNFDCEYYAQDDNCAKFGDDFENIGATANQACCVCGGGKDTSNPSPTSSPVFCTDSPPGWSDSTGPNYDCEYYAVNNNCAKFGDMYEVNGVTANQACCVCGGGEDASNPSPVSTPTSSPVANPTVEGLCQDNVEKFQFSTTEKKHCKFFSEDIERCDINNGIGNENCPVTCKTGCKCYDTEDEFLLWNEETRTCKWAAENTGQRCMINAVRGNCPIVCGLCSSTVSTPTSSPVTNPTGVGLCQDKAEKFQFSGTMKKHCEFFGEDIERCDKNNGIGKKNCPVTCKTGCKCYETEGIFFLWNGETRTCKSAAENAGQSCENNATRANCPIVCGLCSMRQNIFMPTREGTLDPERTLK
jgi:hypothetical protein